MRECSIGIVIGLTLLAGLACALEARRKSSTNDYREWKVYGGGPDNIHYSRLTQINRENVRRLEVAWTHDTGDTFEGSEIQCNPVVVNDVLYAVTPKARVIALEAATGKLIWSFDPNHGKKPLGRERNRAVTYWQDGEDKRIFFTFRRFLYALDAKTGRPDSDFGEAGRVDLREGLGRDPTNLAIGATSPGVVYKELLIIGSAVSEGLPSAPGHIRAYDVRTGNLRWTFHTIPQPGEFGYETWPKDAWQYSGGANNWSGMALDERRGLVFAPTGSAAFDFYGANRHGDNLFANSLLCLDAATGKRVWHFQVVKHDVWDRDLPSGPALVTVRRGRRVIEAVAQIAKSGHVFVFERATGKPVFPIEYRKVPTAGVEGEKLAETQPLPLKPVLSPGRFSPKRCSHAARLKLIKPCWNASANFAATASLNRPVWKGPLSSPDLTEGPAAVRFPVFCGSSSARSKKRFRAARACMTATVQAAMAWICRVALRSSRRFWASAESTTEKS